MKQLVFATNNQNKVEEIRDILKDQYEVLSLKDIDCNEDIEETGKTLEENALIKARFVKKHYGYDCFADDSGLEVTILNGAPGVYSARYAEGESHNAEANIKKLLSELKGKANRHAKFRTVIALLKDNKEYLFEGKIEGLITQEPRGNTGFGYDPIFMPDGYDSTFAELGFEIKNKVSHRALATIALAKQLNQ